MMRFVWIGLIGLFLFSCSQDDGKEGTSRSTADPKPFLLNMQHFFTHSENWMSLPVWFEDSLVQAHQLFCLTRNIYHVSLNSADEADQQELDLREIRKYYFNRTGQVDSVEIQYFFDDHKIGIVSFSYPNESDKDGFHEKVDRVLRIPGEGGLTPGELPFILFSKRWSTHKFLSYKDPERKKKYHFMLNEKDFGPLSVDSVIRPGADDYVILGSPDRPTKYYQVINKVHERNVHLYEYHNGSDQLSTYLRSEYPFDVKRTITYSNEGTCTGYLDSTFSGKTFLSRTRGEFKLNKRKLPERLDRLKENQESPTSLVSVEKYIYEYYQDHP